MNGTTNLVSTILYYGNIKPSKINIINCQHHSGTDLFSSFARHLSGKTSALCRASQLKNSICGSIHSIYPCENVA